MGREDKKGGQGRTDDESEWPRISIAVTCPARACVMNISSSSLLHNLDEASQGFMASPNMSRVKAENRKDPSTTTLPDSVQNGELQTTEAETRDADDEEQDPEAGEMQEMTYEEQRLATIRYVQGGLLCRIFL